MLLGPILPPHRFVPRDARRHRDYVYIHPDDGCYSLVGRTGGRQPLSLDSGCIQVAPILAILFEQPNSGWNNRARVDACRGLLPRAVEVGRDFGRGKQSRMFPSRYDRDQFIQVLNVGHFEPNSLHSRSSGPMCFAVLTVSECLHGRLTGFGSFPDQFEKYSYNTIDQATQLICFQFPFPTVGRTLRLR